MIFFHSQHTYLINALIEELTARGFTGIFVPNLDFVYLKKDNKFGSFGSCVKDSIRYTEAPSDSITIDLDATSWNDMIAILDQHFESFTEGDWVALDNCGDDEDETWITRFGEEYEYKGGTEWQNALDLLMKEGRSPTDNEILEALLLEARRRFDVPCNVRYLDSPTTIKKLKGLQLEYDRDLDVLFASQHIPKRMGGYDRVYERGKWAQPIPSRFFDCFYADFDKSCEIGDHSYNKAYLRQIKTKLNRFSKETQKKTIKDLIDELTKIGV